MTNNQFTSGIAIFAFSMIMTMIAVTALNTVKQHIHQQNVTLCKVAQLHCSDLP